MSLSLALYLAIGLLMIDSIIELAFITSMVSWLHNTASGTFVVNDNGSTFDLAWKPKNFLLDQGHTSNGAAGTAFVLVGLVGFFVLWLRGRRNYHTSKFSIFLYNTWLVFCVLACMLTIGALGYVFAVTNAHDGQTIDIIVARTLRNQAKYPLDTWTPQNWFDAVLKLDLADESVRSDISHHLRIMRGWQYNLIPMFVIQFFTTILILLDARQRRKSRPNSTHYSSVEQKALP